MRASSTVVVSLAFHAVAIPVCSALLPQAMTTDEAPVRVELSVVPDPIDIELLAPAPHDDAVRSSQVPQTTTSRAGSSTASSSVGRSSDIAAAPDHQMAVNVGTMPTAESVPGDSTAAATRGSTGTSRSLLTMRGPDLRVGDRAARDILGATPPHDSVVRSGRLAESGGGTAVVHDGVSTLTVDRDGTAHFHDHADIDLHWDFHLTPTEIKAEIVQAGRELATWAADPYAKARVGAPQDVPAYLAAVPGACDHWDDDCSTELRERNNDVDSIERMRRGTVGHGKLDVTSFLMRHTVGDPFASRKLKILDDTREERAALATVHHDEDVGRSSELMLRNLEQLWRTTPDPRARREALFQLWDECDEATGPDGEAGQRARAMVIGWIRTKLPRGSPDAYGADEIGTRSARRTSIQPFDPYE